MTKYLSRIFLPHFLIFLTYTIIIGFKTSFSNSIGSGIQLAVAMYFHLFITLFFIAAENTANKPTLKKLPLQFVTMVVVFIIGVFFLVTPIWNWLWELVVKDEWQIK